ncbi:hypothetical protein QJS04_geneDACA001044 [Acorus gramineus]|uniref:Uncharacterized protein n=1 Tax=Acorus gramineus TaxID=55184 RepID=A0AAV9ADS9_ACOGR|nr:hypothetical protein QJS04_geneDACA001044 [Acorus gramineus]
MVVSEVLVAFGKGYCQMESRIPKESGDTHLSIKIRGKYAVHLTIIHPDTEIGVDRLLRQTVL